MPSNKKVKSKEAKEAKLARKQAAAAEKPETLADDARNTNSGPTLTMVAFFAFCASRLTQLHSSTTSQVGCEQYFESETCQDPAVQLLLQAKFASAAGGLAVLVAGAIQSWSSADLLTRYQSLMAVGLLLPTAIALVLSPTLESKAAWRFITMLSLLAAVAVPNRDSLPFWNKRELSKATTKTLPSLGLLSLMGLQVVQLGQLGLSLLSSADGAATLSHSLVQKTPASDMTTLWLFFGVDYIAVGAVYAFLWYYFSTRDQRTFFFFHGTVKLIESFALWSSVVEAVPEAVYQQQLTVAVAVASFVCRFAPDIALPPSPQQAA